MIDLVFTSVVLIHIPDQDINKVINEIFRVSSKFILIIEYFSPVDECVTYKLKMIYYSKVMEVFPDNFKELKLVDYGFFGKGLQNRIMLIGGYLKTQLACPSEIRITLSATVSKLLV